MKALDIYRDILRELDKYGSPTFTIRDFNYFVNSAVSEYINENYVKLDVRQKDSDDMRYFLITNSTQTVNSSGLMQLPGNYRHVLDVQVNAKFLKDVGRFKKDQVATIPVERMKSSQKGFRNRNSFGKPSFNRFYFDITGTSMQVYFDSSAVTFTGSNNAKIDYVIQPSDIYLNPDKTSDYNNSANNTSLVFSPTTTNQIYFEVVKKTRDLFLENIESPRLQTAIQQSIARKE